MEKKLPDGFRFVDLTLEEYQKRWNEWGPKIFDEQSTDLDLRKVLSEEERAQVRELDKNRAQLLKINIGVFKGELFCGWFGGDQYDWETFYMRNSAVLPEFRRLGIYTALMTEVLERARKLGFQIVLSRHTVTNNSIIIPKLKAGFIIAGMELSDRFGTLVHLKYYFNETRRKVMVYRAGDLKPDAQLKEAMGIM
jgi:GNAT superfamily N-acetyltransferase